MKEGALLNFCEKVSNEEALKSEPGIDEACPSVRLGVVRSIHGERLWKGRAGPSVVRAARRPTRLALGWPPFPSRATRRERPAWASVTTFGRFIELSFFVFANAVSYYLSLSSAKSKVNQQSGHISNSTSLPEGSRAPPRRTPGPPPQANTGGRRLASAPPKAAALADDGAFDGDVPVWELRTLHSQAQHARFSIEPGLVGLPALRSDEEGKIAAGSHPYQNGTVRCGRSSSLATLSTPMCAWARAGRRSGVA